MQTLIPFWKLRRLAARARRVIVQFKAKAASIAAYEQPLELASTSFITTYDRLRLLQVARATELAQGKLAVDLLYRLMRSWIGLVAANRSISGFDASEYGDNPEVMDDVINDGKSFVEIVQQHADKIVNSDVLLEEVGGALEVAIKEWSEAESLRQEYQELVEENRKNAEILHELLVAFRSTLRLTIGRANPAYQTLRVKAIKRDVLEPGEEADLPPDMIPVVDPDSSVSGKEGAEA